MSQKLDRASGNTGRKTIQAVCLTGLCALLLLTAGAAFGQFPETETTVLPDTRPDSVSLSPSGPVDIKTLQALVYEDPDSALTLLRQLLALADTIQYEDLLFEYQLTSGLVAIRNGSFEEGKRWCMQAALQSRRTTRILTNSSRALSNIGNAYSYLSAFREAARYYYYAALIAEKDPDSKIYIGKYYNNIATVLLSIGQYNQAEFYLKKAEATNNIYGTYSNLSSVYSNLGVLYSKEENFELARKYFELALETSRKYKKDQSEIISLINLGANLIELGRPSEAIPYLQEVLRMDRHINPYYREVNALCLLGTAYIYTKDYGLAEKNLLKTIELATEYNIPEFRQGAHLQLFDLYDQTGDYKNAFIHQQAYMWLKDSILSNEKTQAINTLEVRYRTAQKDKELIEKQLLIRNQERRLATKNILIAGTATAALLLVIILLILFQKYRHRQRLQKKQILILKQEQEISRLKAIMQGEEKERIRLGRELHDGIGGTLAAVKLNFAAVQKNFKFLGSTESFSEAVQMLDMMSTELREAAHNLMPESIIQNGLPESVRRYCAQIQKGKEIDIEFQGYGTFADLNPDLVVSVYRIIQELLHNIVKHSRATHAIVQLSHHNELLSIVIEDNGIGFDPLDESKGIGLKNLRSRVDRLYGKLNIDTSPDTGTTFYLEFELNPKNSHP